MQAEYKKIIKFRKINFLNGNFNDAYDKIKRGGLLVAPAASALIEIKNDKIYHNSLIESDVALFDSGFLCILLRIFKKYKVRKLSGYKFLKELLNIEKNLNKVFLLIDPTKDDAFYNKKYLKEKKFKKVYSIVAPFFKDNKNFNKEKKLLKKIRKYNPDFIIINIAGGKQEPLGLYIKKNISKKTSIICTGAAIAFLTKRQAPINDFIDAIYLGWALRLIFSPANTYKRFLKSFRLINYFF